MKKTVIILGIFIITVTVAFFAKMFMVRNQKLPSITDQTDNINVMLTRADNWEKIVSEPFMSIDEVASIDGSTATVPIKAELYRQFFNYTDEKINYIPTHSTTHIAYRNLIDQTYNYIPGVVLATPPSENEYRYAKEMGVELDVTPIALDGFVFITHKDNPIDNLTVQQIIDIYSGKITNWRDVGGENLKIRAYQREEDSGSQTYMEEQVMKGISMESPQMAVEKINSMSRLIEGVAEYENGKASIGYTYYYYINNLYKNENIKVIKINGKSPENENLQDASYPFTATYCAVIISRDKPKDYLPNGEIIVNPDTLPIRFRDYLISDEGQRLIEMAGYCRAR